MDEYISKGNAIFSVSALPLTLDAETTQRAIEAVRAVPAADVVEVVRCKDCDLWNEWDEAGHKKLGNYACSCAYFSNEDGYLVYTGPDDYCSYGERKEG